MRSNLCGVTVVCGSGLRSVPLTARTFRRLRHHFPGRDRLLRDCCRICLVTLHSKGRTLTTTCGGGLIAAFPRSSCTITVTSPGCRCGVQVVSGIRSSVCRTACTDCLTRSAIAIHHGCHSIDTGCPLTSLLPGFVFLRTLACIRTKSTRNFGGTLGTLIRGCPATSIARLTNRVLGNILHKHVVIRNNVEKVD